VIGELRISLGEAPTNGNPGSSADFVSQGLISELIPAVEDRHRIPERERATRNHGAISTLDFQAIEQLLHNRSGHSDTSGSEWFLQWATH